MNGEMDKPNILIIGNFHSHPSAEAFLRRFLRLMVVLSRKVALISGDSPKEFCGKIVWLKTNLKITRSFIHRVFNYNLAQLQATAYLAKLIANTSYDIVIFLGAHPLPILASKILKRKAILYQGGSYSKQTFGNRIGLREYPLILLFETLPRILSNRIIVESKSCLSFQSLEKYMRKTLIGHLFINEGIFRRLKKISERCMCIGYIGSLDENKGVHKYLEAIIALKDYLKLNNVTVIVGGDGPLLHLLKKRVKRFGLSKNVIFTGWIKHEAVALVLNKLKLIVLPSYSEGLPNILLEAMACGTPVIATPVGAIPDIIKEGETGFLLKSNDPEHIADRIVELLSKPELLEKVSVNAYNYVRENFSYEKTLEAWRKILSELQSNK